ncbi:nucleolar protein 14 isoform X2 [Stigmatopora argus]
MKVPKKRNLADKVRKVKTSTEIKNNPFEVKINRKKFDVLGRKGKHDVGLPGVSRSKAINKRKNTLLKEYKQKNKNSKFIDRRIGEYDVKMAPEDKILQRFAMERQRAHEKKDMYNLNEEDELTHFGQSLSEMEKFTDMVNSDDESDGKGLLSAELTDSHFGGGGLLRKKTPGESADDDSSPKAKSRQELIEELIHKSKQEKRERQVLKEEAQVLTEKLDEEWKSVQALMVRKKPKDQQEEEKPKIDEYDKMVRELGFEMKAQPSEKLKTPEELAREAQEKLQKLEVDRLRRMMGVEVTEGVPTRSHMSADDLNDGFILDKADKKTLAYQDGKWNLENNEDAEKAEEEQSEEGEEAEEEEEEEERENEDGSASEEEEEEEEEDKNGSAIEEEEEENEEEEEDENGDSDLASEQDSEEDEEVRESKSKEERKAQQEAAKAELPYTFTVPESSQDLEKLLRGHSPDNQRLIVARTQKCNHPSLGMGNKLKLQKLMGFLLEYLGELASRNPPELTTVDKLIPEVYSLCQMFPEAACKSMQKIIRDATRGMDEVIEVKGNSAFPTLDKLIYLKVAALLFPTSDFRHPVTTPALLYIGQALTKCPVRSLEDVTSGLALCCLAVEYVSFSKRFLPELINFLSGILHLAAQDKTTAGYSVVPPFKKMGKHNNLLVLSNPESLKSWSKERLPLSATLKWKNDIDADHYRLSCTSTCMELLKSCSVLYKDLACFTHIFQPIKTLLSQHISANLLPESLRALQVEILEVLGGTSQAHRHLVFDKKKPVPLKLFTPKIVEVLDYGKKRGVTREQKEEHRMRHKYKKEFKGALREIRKDTRFLATEKLNDIMTRDTERKRKVKELFGSLATQEGEWKALKRMKRK